jgi:NitT/TauT family transport system substrate-binding protein
MDFSPTRRQALIGLSAIGASVVLGSPVRAATRNLAVLHLASHAPSYIAFERGYFKDAGLDIALKFFEAAQPMAVAIASGDADFGVTAMSGGLISLADKGAIKVIGGALCEEQGITGNIILASNKAYDGGLTDPSRLAGHSFGITTAGSSFHFMAHKIAKANNIALSDIQLRCKSSARWLVPCRRARSTPGPSSPMSPESSSVTVPPSRSALLLIMRRTIR